MADRNLALSLLITAKDQATAVIAKVRSALGGTAQETDSFSKNTDAATDSTDKFNTKAGLLRRTLSGLAGVLSAGFSLLFLKKSADDADALDVQMRKLQATIKATGGAAGLTAAEIDDMARRLDEATLGSASGFRDAAAQLLTFKSIGRDAFETTLKLAQDLAATGFGTITQNAVQLGKALESPNEGLSALSRSGVTFSKEQKELIKSLVETGRQAEAQGLILEAVAGQVGGVAEAMGGGLAGAADLAGKKMTDLREVIGQKITPAMTIFFNGLANIVSILTKVASGSDEAGQSLNRFGGFAEGLARITGKAFLFIDRLSRGIGALAAKIDALSNLDFAAIEAIEKAFDEDNAKAVDNYNQQIEELRKSLDDLNNSSNVVVEPKVDVDAPLSELDKIEAAAGDVLLKFQEWAAAGRNIEDVAAELRKLSDRDLADLKSALESAFDAGIDRTEELTKALESINAEEVTRAWKTLGQTSQQSLDGAAQAAKRAYLTIRDSGTASSNDLAKAWDAYIKKIKEAKQAIDQTSDAEQRRKEGLAELDSIGAGPESTEQKKQRLAEETYEYKRLLDQQEFERAAVLAQQSEQLALDIAKAEQEAYQRGEATSWDAERARESYNDSVDRTIQSLDKLSKREQEALPEPGSDQDNGIEQRVQAGQQLIELLNEARQPVNVQINDNFDQVISKIDIVQARLNQLNASMANTGGQVAAGVDQADAIAREALQRGRR